jgi:hypothetical protein
MCKVHDGEPELARLSRLRKSQIKDLLVPPRSRSCIVDGETLCHAHVSSVSKASYRSALGSPYCSGRSRHLVKSKNPAAPAVKREAEEDWSK